MADDMGGIPLSSPPLVAPGVGVGEEARRLLVGKGTAVHAGPCPASLAEARAVGCYLLRADVDAAGSCQIVCRPCRSYAYCPVTNARV